MTTEDKAQNQDTPASEEDLLNIDTEQVTGFLLIRAGQLWKRAIESVMSDLDLTDTQFFVMSFGHFLSQKYEFVTQALIAQESDMDTMMISQVVRRLETKGYLTREPHPSDSRAKILRLTDAGKKKLIQARSAVLQKGNDFFSVIDQPENFNQQLRNLYDAHLNCDDK